MSASVSETLHRAADLIEERGWRTGGGWPEGDVEAPLCLEGGVMAAMGLNLRDDETDYQEFQACPAYRAVHAYLQLPSGQSLYSWNDHRHNGEKRGQAKVIQVLRGAAAIEAAREFEAATGALTLDDLERLAFKYGGAVEVDLSSGAYWLRGAIIGGTSVNLGPVHEAAASEVDVRVVTSA